MRPLSLLTLALLLAPASSRASCTPIPQDLLTAEANAGGNFGNDRILSASAKITDFALTPGNGLVSAPIDGRKAGYSERLAQETAKGIAPIGAVSDVAQSLSDGSAQSAPSDGVFKMVARWVPRHKEGAVDILSIIGEDGRLPEASGPFIKQFHGFLSTLHASRGISKEDIKALKSGGGTEEVEEKVKFYLNWAAAGSRTIIMGVDEDGERPKDGDILSPIAGGFLSCGHLMNGG